MTSIAVRTHLKTIRYDMCEKCGSLWLDAGDLRQLAYHVQGDIEFCSQEPAPGVEAACGQCPRCDNARLYPVRFLDSTDILLRRCRNCGGFWLQPGQLDAIDKELADIMPVSGKDLSEFVDNIHLPYWRKRYQARSSSSEIKLEAAPIAGAVRTGPGEGRCPACGEPLAAYQLGSVRFEGCNACKGMWLFPSELRRLKDKVGDGALRWMNDEIEAIGQAAAMETKRVCPHCPEQRLTAVRFGRSTVMMDWCPQCRGVWLDRDEFSVVYDYLRQESEAMKPGDIEKELLAEIRRPNGDESRVDEIRALRSGLLAMLNATVIEHPALGRLCANIPRVFL